MWWILLIISVIFIVLLTPITPIKEHFSIYDGIQEYPAHELIRNGQREEEQIHRQDVLSRIRPFIPTPSKDVPDIQQTDDA
jgi:uncharacterized membrane protein YcaP (DUF421 family)